MKSEIFKVGTELFGSGYVWLVRNQNGKLVDISRDGGDGRLVTTRFKLKEIKAGKIQDPRLQPGDRIEVVR